MQLIALRRAYAGRAYRRRPAPHRWSIESSSLDVEPSNLAVERRRRTARALGCRPPAQHGLTRVNTGLGTGAHVTSRHALGAVAIAHKGRPPLLASAASNMADTSEPLYTIAAGGPETGKHALRRSMVQVDAATVDCVVCQKCVHRCLDYTHRVPGTVSDRSPAT